jgi:hypothetical protein
MSDVAVAVLIFSTDSLAGALLGAAVELSGYRPIFPRESEAPREALLRTRPAVALIDCDHEGACAESFFGPALMMGATIAIFSSHRSRRQLEPIAEQFCVRTFRLPIDFDELRLLLDDCATRAGS